MTHEEIRENIAAGYIGAVMNYVPTQFKNRYLQIKKNADASIISIEAEYEAKNALSIDIIRWLDKQTTPVPSMWSFEDFEVSVLFNSEGHWRMPRFEVGKHNTHKVWIPNNFCFAIKVAAQSSWQYDLWVGGVPTYDIGNDIHGYLDPRIGEVSDFIEGPYDSPYRYAATTSGIKQKEGINFTEHKFKNRFILLQIAPEAVAKTRGTGNTAKPSGGITLSKEIQSQKPNWLGEIDPNRQFFPMYKIIIEVIPFEI